MTARFMALYETPADPTAFDRHYRDVHIPLGRDVVAVRGGELEWDTMEELRAALASPEEHATAADAAHARPGW
ncbi:EthD family reductase [Streptomyces sp. NPDC002928]|uniref:EthD family reductase n=1 Tax=Streptomyces sp. NPDC002928 TaxID=3154440 RepID=UPI0033BCB99D